tara:strand:+ start:259 stop:657 length:399 start_codon:yes stop_codon:yes gene_type:complete
MKNYELIIYKKKIIAFVVRKKFKASKTKFFGEEKNSLQFGHIVKNKGDKIPRHRHKKVKRTLFGTPEILIVYKGETILSLFKNGKILKKIKLKKGDLVSLIDCEHSFIFNKNTVLHEIKQGPYIKNEKIIYD